MQAHEGRNALCGHHEVGLGEGDAQALLYGIGDLHLEVVVAKLLAEYKVGIDLTKPKVAFRETIRKNSDVEYKYKKQTGGHGQYGHVELNVIRIGGQMYLRKVVAFVKGISSNGLHACGDSHGREASTVCKCLREDCNYFRWDYDF